MALRSLLKNTIEGTLQTAVGATKAVAGAAVSPLDDGRTFEDGLDNIADGVHKIGNADEHPDREDDQ